MTLQIQSADGNDPWRFPLDGKLSSLGVFAINLLVTRQRLDDGRSTKQFGNDQFSALADQILKLVVEDQRSFSTAHHAIFQRTQSFTIGNSKVKQIQAFVIQNQTDGLIGFVVTGTASKVDFDKARPNFEQFIKHFCVTANG